MRRASPASGTQVTKGSSVIYRIEQFAVGRSDPIKREPAAPAFGPTGSRDAGLVLNPNLVDSAELMWAQNAPPEVDKMQGIRSAAKLVWHICHR
jgi:hypothetical protein